MAGQLRRPRFFKFLEANIQEQSIALSGSHTFTIVANRSYAVFSFEALDLEVFLPAAATNAIRIHGLTRPVFEFDSGSATDVKIDNNEGSNRIVTLVELDS